MTTPALLAMRKGIYLQVQIDNNTPANTNRNTGQKYRLSTTCTYYTGRGVAHKYGSTIICFSKYKYRRKCGWGVAYKYGLLLQQIQIQLEIEIQEREYYKYKYKYK